MMQPNGAKKMDCILRIMVALVKRKCVMVALCVAMQAKKSDKNGLKITQKQYRLLLNCRTLSKSKDQTDRLCVTINIF